VAAVTGQDSKTVPDKGTAGQEVELYHFQDWPVRVIWHDGQPWWVAKDACGLLGIKQAGVALKGLEDDEKVQVSIPEVSSNNVSQMRQVWLVNEYGLYQLVLRSRKPVARKFQRWITHEVLPDIRLTGGYSAGTWLDRDHVEFLHWLESNPLVGPTYRSLGPEGELVAWCDTIIGTTILALRSGDRRTVNDIRQLMAKVHGRTFKDLESVVHRYCRKEAGELGARYVIASRTGNAEEARNILADRQPGLRVIDGGQQQQELGS
jgi:prophage antirepressor-like protein